jgi:hypothetical protein
MRLERMTAVVVLATGLLAGGAALAQTDKEPADKQPLPPSLDVPRGPKAPLKKATAKPAELLPQQKVLEGLVGQWKFKMHVPQQDPNAPAQDIEGTAEGKLIMGGRFVAISHQGMTNGTKLEGLNTIGFDNVINRYVSSWVDNATNGIIHFVGTYDATKKQLTMEAHYSDPVSRRLTIARTVTTFVDAKTWTYEEFISHAKGEKETPSPTITFKKD